MPLRAKDDALLFTSIQAPNQETTGRHLSQYVGRRLGLTTDYVEDKSWQERERLLDSGEIQVGWICGLPYIRKVDRPNPSIELLAAPVMSGDRYQNRSIYFSDVVVHRNSQYFDFASLRGCRWAYNEPNSQSGYNITRYHLATLGEMAGYFSSVIAAGSHQNALEMVLSREIDATAIDSTVLEIELAQRPALRTSLRVVEILGPSPIPPWVVSLQLDPELRQTIRKVFLTLDQDASGQELLRQAGIHRFAPVTDQDYDLIRQMAREADRVSW